MSKISHSINKIFFLLIVASFLLAMKKDAHKPVVIGYVTGYNGLIDASQIAAEKLTHINYAFVNVKDNRAFLQNLKTDTINFERLNTLKLKNPKLQLLISIGGWSWSENFSDAVLTDSLRRIFAASAVEIIRKYKFDGVDIDWEYPGMAGEQGNVYRPEDKENFTLMFEAIRKELNVLEKETGKKKLLTTATGGFASFLTHTEMGKAARYLDFINLMTYDYYSSKLAGHHTNLYESKTIKSDHSADKAIQAYINAGVPAAKIVMGIAFYGRNLQLSPNAQKGLGDTVLSNANSYGKGYTFLKDSLANKKGFLTFRDEEAKAPYLFNTITKQYISYDDEWSVANKCDYVLKNKLGGVMFWEYSSDKKGYLLDQIGKSFK